MQPATIINIVLQSIVAVFLIWYAIETYRLRKQTAYQCRISIQPIIDFPSDKRPRPPRWALQNVGLGPALNLHLYVWVSKTSQLHALPNIKRPSILKPNERIDTDPLELIDSSQIKKKHPKLAKIITNMPLAGGAGTLIAIYEDSAGNVYYSQQYADPVATKPFSYGLL
jgi:hypothetical protein